MIHNENELLAHEQGYKSHAFNQMVSDRLGNHARNLLDHRDLRYGMTLLYLICKFKYGLSCCWHRA